MENIARCIITPNAPISLRPFVRLHSAAQKARTPLVPSPAALTSLATAAKYFNHTLDAFFLTSPLGDIVS